MQDPAARQHPAGRDNDGGTWPGVKDLRGLDVPNESRVVAAQRAGMLVHEQVHLEIVVVSIFAVNLAGIYGHGAINEYRKSWDPFLVFQLSDVIQNLLGSTCREGRD